MKVARSEPVGRFMAGAAEAESMLMIDTIRLAMKAPRIHPLLNESVRNLLSPSNDLCHRISSRCYGRGGRILPPFRGEGPAKRTKGAAVEGAGTCRQNEKGRKLIVRPHRLPINLLVRRSP